MGQFDFDSRRRRTWIRLACLAWTVAGCGESVRGGNDAGATATSASSGSSAASTTGSGGSPDPTDSTSSAGVGGTNSGGVLETTMGAGGSTSTGTAGGGSGGASSVEMADPTTCAEREDRATCEAVRQADDVANGRCYWVPTYVVDDVTECGDARTIEVCQFRWGASAGSIPTQGCDNHGVWRRVDGDSTVFADEGADELPDPWVKCTTTALDECGCGCEVLVTASGE